MLLFEAYKLGNLQLANRIVMAPMTRSKAIEHNAPNALMAKYYSQRASAGLIITEGVSPSPNGLGYPRIPGLFNGVQLEGWRQVTEAVHAKGGKIFMQIMHTGRVSHQDNLPVGAIVVGPSPEVSPGEIWVDKTNSKQPHTTPHSLSYAEIKNVIEEYANAARLAIEAGFDGVELHGANGYLIEEFLNPNINYRMDDYGVDMAGRNRFAVEVAKSCAKSIGPDRVGIRIFPQEILQSVSDSTGLVDQFLELTRDLSKIGLVYLHLIDHSSVPIHPEFENLKGNIRKEFSGALIVAGGFTAKTAEMALEANDADLVAFGRPFISNPDLVHKLKNGIKPIEPDMNTFYSLGERGYTDY